MSVLPGLNTNGCSRIWHPIPRPVRSPFITSHYSTSAQKGQSPSLASIWALLAQNGVSIVLNGHDHDYQRWVPLDGNGQPSPKGITEFVAGGGGHGIQKLSKYRQPGGPIRMP